MAQILVRNIDDDVKEALRSRAKARGHSLEEYARVVLRADAMRNEAPGEGLATRITRMVRESGLVFPRFESLRVASRPPIDFGGYGEYGDDDAA